MKESIQSEQIEEKNEIKISVEKRKKNLTKCW